MLQGVQRKWPRVVVVLLLLLLHWVHNKWMVSLQGSGVPHCCCA